MKAEIDTKIVRSRILDLIDRHRKERNFGVLLVTGKLSVISRLADGLMVTQEGKVVEIVSHPDKDYSRSLLAAHSSLYGKNIDWETTL